ncbi:MAG: helix-turn-helix domain-containing protein [Telmatospirillum sp.]|nr:helix-turn-helix domain-containing protein [Telmatospirillum sp.]
MSTDLLTVDQAARRLSLHPKTVLRFIHDGRLSASRIGRSYRIQESHLAGLVGIEEAGAAVEARATSIVELAQVTPENAAGLSSLLQASLATATARPDPVHLDTAYDPARRTLKIVVIAAPADAASLLQALAAFLEAHP